MSYETRLERAVTELETRGEIQLERMSPDPDLTPERLALLADADLTLDRINALWSTPLDDILRPYHFTAAEYHAGWITGDGRVRGEFCLGNIHDCLVEHHPQLRDEGLGLDERGVLPQLKIFDQAPFGGAGEVTGLRMPRANGRPPMRGRLEIWHYVSTQSRLHRLNVGYGTYLETLLITKGAWGWQYLFADACLDHDVASNLAAMLETFPVLFPDYDYEPLRARWAERQGR